MVMKLTTVILVLLLAVPSWAQAPSRLRSGQADADVWRTYASRIEIGSRVKLRLRDGQRVSATLIGATPYDLVIQPRTRIPVPVQHVPYEAIMLLERDDARGMGAGKAVAIGVAAGVGAFLGALLLLVATID
jgi:hypothetical protein